MELPDAFELCKEILSDLGGLRIRDLNEQTKPSRILPSSGGFDFVGLRFENDVVRPTRRAIDDLYKRVHKIMDPRSTTSLKDRYVECDHFLSGWRAAYASVANIQSYIDQAASKAAEAVHRLLRSRGLSPRRKISTSQQKFLRVLPRTKKRAFSSSPRPNPAPGRTPG